MALGAERSRIIRLLLIENLFLAFAGTVLGLLLAGWCVARLSEMREVSPLLARVGLHPEILLFAAGLMVFTTLLFGLAPAIRVSSFDIANGLTIFYVLHTRTAPLGLTSAVRHAIQEVDASIPVYDIRSMEERISESMGQRRLATTFLTVFALIGTLLAAIGIFGVIATWVRHRLHELGIRVALGAQPEQIFKLVVGQGMWMAATGVVVGCLASLVATRFLEALLFDVEPYDPYTFAIGIGLLFAVAFLACYVPAKRAMKLDPIIVLRYE